MTAMAQHIPFEQDCSEDENPLIDSTFQMVAERTEPLPVNSESTDFFGHQKPGHYKTES